MIKVSSKVYFLLYSGRVVNKQIVDPENHGHVLCRHHGLLVHGDTVMGGDLERERREIQETGTYHPAGVQNGPSTAPELISWKDLTLSPDFGINLRLVPSTVRIKTIQGYSDTLASWPPTILLSSLFTPHLVQPTVKIQWKFIEIH